MKKKIVVLMLLVVSFNLNASDSIGVDQLGQQVVEIATREPIVNPQGHEGIRYSDLELMEVGMLALDAKDNRKQKWGKASLRANAFCKIMGHSKSIHQSKGDSFFTQDAEEGRKLLRIDSNRSGNVVLNVVLARESKQTRFAPGKMFKDLMQGDSDVSYFSTSYVSPQVFSSINCFD